MDERLRGLDRARRQDPHDTSGNARYLRELERLVFGGDREALPAYARAGGVWIEDLTNQCALLEAEGLPVEKDVPVFRFYGVRSRGEQLVVTVRDLLEGIESDTQSQTEYWLPRTQAHVYGHWELPDAYEQMVPSTCS